MAVWGLLVVRILECKALISRCRVLPDSSAHKPHPHPGEDSFTRNETDHSVSQQEPRINAGKYMFLKNMSHRARAMVPKVASPVSPVT